MEYKLTINSGQIDASVGLNAYYAYKNQNYPLATELLLQVLDVEPTNWLARLYLGVCYHKVGQHFSCQRAFKYMVDNCPDSELHSKAERAHKMVTQQIEGGKPSPSIFGAYGEQRVERVFDIATIIMQ